MAIIKNSSSLPSTITTGFTLHTGGICVNVLVYVSHAHLHVSPNVFF